MTVSVTEGDKYVPALSWQPGFADLTADAATSFPHSRMLDAADDSGAGGSRFWFPAKAVPGCRRLIVEVGPEGRLVVGLGPGDRSVHRCHFVLVSSLGLGI
eukprot:3370335-Rhodomonas_salina.1